MHEMSLCETVVSNIEESAKLHSFLRVNRVVLEIGKLSCVEIEAMRFAFDLVAKDSVARGSILDIVVKPGLAWCYDCDQQLEVQERYEACSNCGSYPLKITGGEELRIKELEVE